MAIKRFCYFTVFGRKDQHLIRKQVRPLLDRGVDVTLVFADGLPDETVDEIHFTSIPVRAHIGKYFTRLFTFQKLFYKKLKEIDADVYQSCDVDSLLVCLLLKRRGKKVVFNLLEEHPYTLYSKLHLPRIIVRSIVSLWAGWMKYVFKRIDSVFTVAPDIENYLKRWGVKKHFILGNYPVVDESHEISLEEYLSRENRIVYFGAIYGISRQEVFLKALSRFDKVNYLIAGDFGVGNYRERLESMPEWNKVEFINRFPKSELNSILSRCSISNVLRDFKATGYPSGSYGVIKVFESMEAGLPIICANVPVYREIMKQYKCGILVNPNCEEEIYDAINYLVSNRKEAYEMGQNGRRAVIERYNWAMESVKYVSAIMD